MNTSNPPKSQRRNRRPRDTIPYGTFSDANPELRSAYYRFGYRNDADLPPLPEVEPDELIEDPERDCERKELVRIVRELLDGLSPRLSKILCLRYGIDGYSDHTYAEISRMFDLSIERIRQIEAVALRRLKHPSRSDVLRQFLPDLDHYDLYHIRMRQILHPKPKAIPCPKLPQKEHKPKTWLQHLQETDPTLYKRIQALAKLNLAKQYEVPVSP